MTYKIRDLGVISDRRSGALIAKNGDICWYCPGQFDNPSLFASLPDEEKEGLGISTSTVAYEAERKYIENSSIRRNMPRSFVHASCIGAIIDFNNTFGNISGT